MAEANRFVSEDQPFGNIAGKVSVGLLRELRQCDPDHVDTLDFLEELRSQTARGCRSTKFDPGSAGQYPRTVARTSAARQRTRRFLRIPVSAPVIARPELNNGLRVCHDGARGAHT
jgi:hypothetical protein